MSHTFEIEDAVTAIDRNGQLIAALGGKLTALMGDGMTTAKAIKSSGLF